MFYHYIWCCRYCRCRCCRWWANSNHFKYCCRVTACIQFCDYVFFFFFLANPRLFSLKVRSPESKIAKLCSTGSSGPRTAWNDVSFFCQIGHKQATSYHVDRWDTTRQPRANRINQNRMSQNWATAILLSGMVEKNNIIFIIVYAQSSKTRNPCVFITWEWEF